MFVTSKISIMQIFHLKNNDIDYVLWDERISMSLNGLLYAYSWYLDIVSPDWEALVTADYEYVMPLPKKQKYSISYLTQPCLTQQLGIFSKKLLTEDIVKKFIRRIPYLSYELNLNESNYYPNAIKYPNYMLDLNQSYNDIYSEYSKNTKRNIDKAQRLKLRFQSDLSLNDFAIFYFSTEKNHPSVNRDIMCRLISKGIEKDVVLLYGVRNSEGCLLSALCLLRSLNRIIYLVAVSNAEGKSSSAMFLLADKIICQEAGSNKVLDFEGSRIEGLARFYKSFGAEKRDYYTIKRFRPAFLIHKK